MTRFSVRHPFLATSGKVFTLFIVGLIIAESAFRFFLYFRNNFLPGSSPSTYEIYAVGESTTEGLFYEERLSFPELAAFSLGERVGHDRIVVRNLAQRGHRISHQSAVFQLRTAHRKRVPGAVMIYSGHNDTIVYSDQYLNNVSIGTLLDEFLSRHSMIYTEFLNLWNTRTHFPKQTSEEEQRTEMFHTYECHLRRIIELAKRRGLLPILSTVVGNISRHDPGLPLDTDKDMLSQIQRGIDLERQKKFPAALQHYRNLFARSTKPADNYVRYRIARCLEAVGKPDEAKRVYWDVIDSGGDYHRAVRMQNELIQRLAAEYAIPLIDAAQEFERASPSGLTGYHLFVDPYHPNLEGHILLGRLFAEKLSKQLRVPSKPLTEKEVVRRFRLDGPFLASADIMAAAWNVQAALRHALPEERLEQAGRLLDNARKHTNLPDGIKSLRTQLTALIRDPKKRSFDSISRLRDDLIQSARKR